MPGRKPVVVNDQGRLFSGSTIVKKSPSSRIKVVKKSTGPKKIELLPGKKRWLSATSISSSQRCPHCFWLQINCKIYQPEGIVSRLANRFDVVIKKYFDLYRGSAELPPLIAGDIMGALESPFQETYFTNLTDKYGFMGKLDECIIDKNGKYIPVDHKTASSDPTTRELIPAYQFQLDSYAFLLEANKKPTAGVGHLIYFFPSEGQHLDQGFPMQVTIKTLATHPERVRPVLLAAIEILEGELPPPSENCPFCQYVFNVKEYSS